MIRLKTKSLAACSLAMLLSLSIPGNASELPLIGDATSGTISVEEEYRLGQAWVRVLRAQTRQLNDPLVYSYLENLVYRLSTYSDLADRRLTLIVQNDPTLNAFAVPGGIVGIHAGLFRYAQTEGQFASVLAHELSHLSQRHYADSLEQQKKSLPLQIATIFGSILLASAGGDGAAAAMASGQAALVQQQLAYSRRNEREADNIGMEVLARAGYAPESMPDMFEQMQQASRFQGRQLPEFLRTHPITQSRIADSQSRAAQIPAKGQKDTLQYQLIRARILTALADDPNRNFKLRQQHLSSQPSPLAHYAFALAAMEINQFELAQQSVDALLQEDGENLTYKILQAELWLAQNQSAQAEALLQRLLGLYPDNHPLTVLYIQSLRLQEKHLEAIQRLKAHLRLYPNQTQLWYQLAESYGLADDIFGVHRARAQYFLLIGATRKAEEHIRLAQRLADINDHDKALLKALMEETLAVRKSLEF